MVEPEGTEISCYFLCDHCGGKVCQTSSQIKPIVLEEIHIPIYCTDTDGKLGKVSDSVRPFYTLHKPLCHPKKPEPISENLQEQPNAQE